MRVVNTFDDHLKHFSVFQIESCLKKIYRANYKTPSEAFGTMKQATKERCARVQRQKQEMRKLNSKLDEMRQETLRNLCRHISKCFGPFVQLNQPVELSEEAAQYSNVILVQICQMIRANARRNSEDIIQRLLCNFADKMGFWMAQFIEGSGFKTLRQNAFDDSGCMQKFLKTCQSPLECRPREDIDEKPSDTEEAAEEAPEDDSDTYLSADDEMKAPTDGGPKLSFLRLSQVKIDPAECQEANARFSSLRAQKGSKKAVSIQKKKNRGVNVAKRNAKKPNLDCFGNVNKMPQWEVEWVDRA